MNEKKNTEDPGSEQVRMADVATSTEVVKPNGFIKNVFLFLIAPFVAIAYAMALPFVGFFNFAKLAHEGTRRKRRFDGKKRV